MKTKTFVILHLLQLLQILWRSSSSQRFRAASVHFLCMGVFVPKRCFFGWRLSIAPWCFKHHIQNVNYYCPKESSKWFTQFRIISSNALWRTVQCDINILLLQVYDRTPLLINVIIKATPLRRGLLEIRITYINCWLHSPASSILQSSPVHNKIIWEISWSGSFSHSLLTCKA